MRSFAGARSATCAARSADSGGSTGAGWFLGEGRSTGGGGLPGADGTPDEGGSAGGGGSTGGGGFPGDRGFIGGSGVSGSAAEAPGAGFEAGSAGWGSDVVADAPRPARLHHFARGPAGLPSSMLSPQLPLARTRSPGTSLRARVAGTPSLDSTRFAIARAEYPGSASA
ncbi:hypothetical protein GCM10018773_20500 [Streptomyces candidus]|nr:hypothetical protein GCM10018773_20500 [Streptomyces candidus]